jgi:hypothetical protein
LERIIRSLVPTALLVAGAVVFVLGTGFLLASDATLFQAIGLAVLAGSVAVARSRRILNSRPVLAVLAGLGLLALSFLAYAIVAGLAFGTLTALGAGLTAVTAIELAAVVALGLAAWTRVRELYR